MRGSGSSAPWRSALLVAGQLLQGGRGVCLGLALDALLLDGLAALLRHRMSRGLVGHGLLPRREPERLRARTVRPPTGAGPTPRTTWTPPEIRSGGRSPPAGPFGPG